MARPKGTRNKATKKHRATISDLARTYADDAIQSLQDIATNGDSESACVAASNSLLDRGYGRPQ